MTIDMHAHWSPPELIDIYRARTEPPMISTNDDGVEIIKLDELFNIYEDPFAEHNNSALLHDIKRLTDGARAEVTVTDPHKALLEEALKKCIIEFQPSSVDAEDDGLLEETLPFKPVFIPVTHKARIAAGATQP